MASCVSWTCLAEIGVVVCYMSVRHPEPECAVILLLAAASKYIYARRYQSYQLMHNTQGAARPRRTSTSQHVHVVGGTPVDLRNFICTSPARLRRVSSRFVQSDEYLFPTRTRRHVVRRTSHPRSPDSASRFVRLVEWPAVSPGRSCGPVSPRSWLDVW